MGSGDEMTLALRRPRRPARRLDARLSAESRRLGQGRDPNTAFSTTVEPLPFHAMSRYPYPATERHPDTAYRANTTPAPPCASSVRSPERTSESASRGFDAPLSFPAESQRRQRDRFDSPIRPATRS